MCSGYDSERCVFGEFCVFKCWQWWDTSGVWRDGKAARQGGQARRSGKQTCRRTDSRVGRERGARRLKRINDATPLYPTSLPLRAAQPRIHVWPPTRTAGRPAGCRPTASFSVQPETGEHLCSCDKNFGAKTCLSTRLSLLANRLGPLDSLRSSPSREGGIPTLWISRAAHCVWPELWPGYGARAPVAPPFPAAPLFPSPPNCSLKWPPTKPKWKYLRDRAM